MLLLVLLVTLIGCGEKESDPSSDTAVAEGSSKK